LDEWPLASEVRFLDWGVTAAGLVVGIVVGLTGMGGGALMTPVLVFLFRIDPLTAVSSDVVSSLFMKPAGAAVHLVRGTANLSLVGWLSLGSVPAAFSGAVLIDRMKQLEGFDEILLTMLGVALLVASAGLVLRSWMQMTHRRLPWGEGPAPMASAQVRTRPLATVLIGAVGGLMVGLTSVGAGSVILILLLMVYPGLKPSQLVGTDLVQAVPLVASASLGHLIFGSVSFGITGGILLGAIPGAFIGAQISSRAPGGIIRRALAILLMASGLKLMGVDTAWVLAAAALAVIAGPVVWIALRRRWSGANAVQPLSVAERGDPDG
jgi:uncharacterized protein